ncbi:MAG: hypothetical protein ACR2PR_10035 [Pseudohongiellaceae bacterium]
MQTHESKETRHNRGFEAARNLESVGMSRDQAEAIVKTVTSEAILIVNTHALSKEDFRQELRQELQVLRRELDVRFAEVDARFTKMDAKMERRITKAGRQGIAIMTAIMLIVQTLGVVAYSISASAAQVQTSVQAPVQAPVEAPLEAPAQSQPVTP